MTRARLFEILVVIGCCVAAVAVAFTLLSPRDSGIPADLVECVNNVRCVLGLYDNQVGKAAKAAKAGKQVDGPPPFLELLRRGAIDGEDVTGFLKCPGDKSGNPCSYMARGATAAPIERGKRAVLIADDSLDHHTNVLVVGYSDGSVKYRTYPQGTKVGKDSQAEELRCLSPVTE